MPRDITTTVYTFSELDEDAQEKALNYFRDFNTSDECWYEHVLDCFREDMEEKGFAVHKDEPQFSGFSSQGDGASFTADVDIEKFILAYKRGNYYKVLLNDLRKGDAELDAQITRASYPHYVHAYMMDIDFDAYFDAGDEQRLEKLEALASELEDEILETARDEAHELYRTLEREYEYQTSDEQVGESLEANEIPFTKDGNPF